MCRLKFIIDEKGNICKENQRLTGLSDDGDEDDENEWYLIQMN